MDAELRAVPFALKVCLWVAGEGVTGEPAITPVFLIVPYLLGQLRGSRILATIIVTMVGLGL